MYPVHAAAAVVAGVLAENGVGEVTLNGRVLRARDGVDLPGEIERAAAEGGAVLLVIGDGRGEITILAEGLRWRGLDADLDRSLRKALAVS